MDKPIEFQLITGENYTGKTVRVLYIHGDTVKTAESAVTDRENGVVTVKAQEFSPYVILSKTKTASGSGSSSSTYPITVTKPTNGTLTVDRDTASRGTTVTVTAEADTGYTIGGVTVTDKNEEQISVTDKGNGKFTFTMPASRVTVKVNFVMAGQNSAYDACRKDADCPIYPFADAKSAAWYHDGVHYCLDNGMMVGTGSDTFAPGMGTTRAQLVVILWRMNGSPAVNDAMDFADVKENAWYTEAIRWALSEKVVQGYGNGKFGPNDTITREQMVTILWRYAQAKGCDVTTGENAALDAYKDVQSISAYAVPAVQWACASGLMQGSNENLDSTGSTTRTQIATMIMRFCVEIVK